MLAEFSGILLVASQGRLLSSLRVLLKSRYPLVDIEQTEDRALIQRILSVGRPRLMMIDAALLSQSGWSWIKEIREGYLEQPMLILTHQPSDVDRARSDGCAALALEGLTCSTLERAIDGYLRE
jgi:DNA-binding response OmpR family regulator